MTEYTRDDILVSGDWLQARLGQPGLRIVDCDLPDAYGRAHLPGAVNPRDHYYKASDDKRFIAGPEQFAAMMEALGIGNETEVVGYDGEGHVVNVMALEIDGGYVRGVRSIVNPDKLGHLGPVADLGSLMKRPRRLRS